MSIRVTIELVDKRECMPDKADEDEYGCILAVHEHNGLMLTNSSNFREYGGHMTHWARCPDLRKACKAES